MLIFRGVEIPAKDFRQRVNDLKFKDAFSNPCTSVLSIVSEMILAQNSWNSSESKYVSTYFCKNIKYANKYVIYIHKNINIQICAHINIYIFKGSLVANFRYTNFWVAGEE